MAHTGLSALPIQKSMESTHVQVMKQTNAQSIKNRLANIEERILRKQTITIKTPLPGIEKLLEAHDIPLDSVFIPSPFLSHEDNQLERRRWKGRKRYEKERLQTSSFYHPRKISKEAEVEVTQEVKLKILRQLKEGSNEATDER